MQPRFVSSTTSQRTKENITPATSVHARDRDEPWSPLPPSSPLPASSPSLPQTPYDHRSSSITIWHLEFSPLPSLLAGIASPEEPSPKRRKTPRYLHEEPVDRDFSMEIDALCAGECMSDCESLCRETLWTKGEETHEGFLAPSARINGYATEVDLESIPMEPLMDTYSYTDSDFSSFLPSLSALSDPLNPSYSLEDPFYDSSMTSPASQFMDFITSPLPIAQDDQPALESSSFRLPRYLQLFDSLFHHDGTFHCKLDESQVDAKDVLEYQLGQPFEPIHLNRCDEEDWGFDDEWAPTFDF
ncbi:hypothetical protein BDV98DRAFT_566529 [Pterulicium gracile]|uniref:Uncharacterized protein n=1 Tax=Pterulicium gracile TaxID=1884261 RepID=A0A5C3QKZ1_9AGAR|nr:hypothetical protein BDV98DRAFT_566529 [Pterula gracilis]